MDAATVRARKEEAVRKLASIFAKRDNGDVGSERSSDRGDAGAAYARLLEEQETAGAPSPAEAALRWLVDRHLPGGGARSDAVDMGGLNPRLLDGAFWRELCAGVGEAAPAPTAAPSSGVPFAAAACASLAAQRLPTPHLPWLAAALALGATVLRSAPRTDSAVRVAAAEADRVDTSLRSAGYAIAHGPSWSPDARAALRQVQAQMRCLKAHGWPAAFCFAFDEAWELLRGVWGVAEQVLGPGCTLEPSVFAWALDPVAARTVERENSASAQRNGEKSGGVSGRGGYIGGNFGLPHRDFSHTESFDAAGTAEDPLPRVLSTWMPLTPVRTDNGCMYVVPRGFDPDFDQPQAFAHLRAATARADEEAGRHAHRVVTECRFDLTAARPLAPASPGDVCMWAGNLIHWGARASPPDETVDGVPPRASLAVTFCRADVTEVHDLGVEQLLTLERAMALTLPERLALIARSLLMHRQWYDLDGGLPPELFAAPQTPPAPAPAPAPAEEHTQQPRAEAAEKKVSESESAAALSKKEGKRWLDAAKAGDLGVLQEMAAGRQGAAHAALLGYQGKGTSYGFTGNCALHWAAAKGHAAVLSWLLTESAELLRVTNHSDATALHSAASNGQAETARLLLAAGAEKDVTDDCDETPFDVATRFGRDEVAALLS